MIVLRNISFKDKYNKIWTFTVKVYELYNFVFTFPDEECEGFQYIANKTNTYYARLVGESLANTEEVTAKIKEKVNEQLYIKKRGL